MKKTVRLLISVSIYFCRYILLHDDKRKNSWLVNGSKVWTSLGALSKWMLLLARTHKTEKHKGITYFICPMDHPGVTVNPIHKMTGESGFNEVVLDNVEVPDDLRIERDGAAALVDEMSLIMLKGSEIDFVDELVGAEFKIRNPNAKSSCGCGVSFSI